MLVIVLTNPRADMKACKVCGLHVSGLELRPVWDKEVQIYVEHYVCRKCRDRLDKLPHPHTHA